MVRVEKGPNPDVGTNLKNSLSKLLKKTTGLFRKGKDLHQIAGAIKEAQELANQLARGTSLSCMAATLVLPLTLV
ncbi:hypothetical protein E2562_036335 [Oryza meyeriana var. granulata]|uniref:Uncharacterized protein n=1 Tax=Oryza meyeriana var. granulata TaxID=110450 RepID=A0A6G1CAV2_9ORYZ|nr:hypothetical protein E2562_036335 [Oryza meyeriana var. granulata]